MNCRRVGGGDKRVDMLIRKRPSLNNPLPPIPCAAVILDRLDLIGPIVCRLTTLEVIRQNEGPTSSLRLQVAAVSCDECGAIPWDELQVSLFAQSIRLQIVFYSTINFLVPFLPRIEGKGTRMLCVSE